MPPRLVNQDQQVQVGIISPPAFYTRTIGIMCLLNAALGFQYMVTPVVGGSILLRRIKLRFSDLSLQKTNLNAFNFVTGATAELNNDNYQTWENLLPVYHPTVGLYEWQFQDGHDTEEWEMLKPLTGLKRRFGVRFTRDGVGTALATASFTFSEG